MSHYVDYADFPTAESSRTMQFVSRHSHMHWRIQGAPRRPPPQDQFLLFSHMFSLKSVRVGGWRPPPPPPPPPPPQREILDPPLIWADSHWMKTKSVTGNVDSDQRNISPSLSLNENKPESISFKVHAISLCLTELCYREDFTTQRKDSN